MTGLAKRDHFAQKFNSQCKQCQLHSLVYHLGTSSVYIVIPVTNLI